MDLGLKEQTAIIIGASRGIGKATALALASEGCHVAICARGEEALYATAHQLEAKGVRVHAAICDDAAKIDVAAAVNGRRRRASLQRNLQLGAVLHQEDCGNFVGKDVFVGELYRDLDLDALHKEGARGDDAAGPTLRAGGGAGAAPLWQPPAKGAQAQRRWRLHRM